MFISGHGQFLWFRPILCMQVWNGAGLSGIYSSLGHTHDSTPPYPGIVYDTLPYMSHDLSGDEDYTPSLSAISASWAGWSDPHTLIVEYYWAIGTCASCNDVQDFLSVGVATGEQRFLSGQYMYDCTMSCIMCELY